MKITKIVTPKSFTFEQLSIGTFFTDSYKDKIWLKVTEKEAMDFDTDLKGILLQIEPNNRPLYKVDVNIEWWLL